MESLAISVLSIYGALASLVGLVFELRPAGKPATPIEITLGVIAALLTVWWTYLAVRQHLRDRPVVCKTDNQILRFMHRWIGREGRVVIFTRDMSWAHSADIEALLFQKSSKNELTIILERSTDLAEKLASSGARIISYNRLGYTPASRFTIVKHGHHDAEVAVGGRIGGQHVINIFQQGHHALFAVANDLANMITAYNELQNP